MAYKQSSYNILVDQTDDGYLIYNSLSGALSLLDKITYDGLMRTCSVTTMDAREIEDLIHHGYIVNDVVDEYSKCLFFERSVLYQSAPQCISIVIAPTLKCNLSCEYCFERQNELDDSFVMTNEVMKNVVGYIIKIINDNDNAKSLFIRWMGGEPLLEVDAIKRISRELINHCESVGIQYSAGVVTNGTLCSLEVMGVLRDECRVKSVQFTFDGTAALYCKRKRATNEIYYKTLNNLRGTQHYFRDVSLRLNADKENFLDLLELTKIVLRDYDLDGKISVYLAKVEGFVTQSKNDIKYLSDIEYEKCNLALYEFFINNDFDTEKIRILSPRRTRCNLMMYNNIVIGPRGEFYRCEHHIGMQSRIVGDCITGRYYPKYELEAYDLTYNESCSRCNLFPLCRAGCPEMPKDGVCSELYREVFTDSVIKSLKIKYQHYKSEKEVKNS